MAPANPRHRLIAPIHAAAAAGGGGGGAGATSPSGLPSLVGIAHLLVSLGIVLASDKFLKQAFAAASIKFPSALFGMFCVFSVLVVLDAFAPALAKGFMDFFEPATLFIQRWLPLFYVPSLVVLPLAVRDVPAASGLKIFLIICMHITTLLSLHAFCYFFLPPDHRAYLLRLCFFRILHSTTSYLIC
jgi:hypothetical protein